VTEQRAGVHLRADRHVLGVDALGDVDDGAGREQRRRQRREVVLLWLDRGAERGLDAFGVLLERLGEREDLDALVGRPLGLVVLIERVD
jgi:hypothetical protein